MGIKVGLKIELKNLGKMDQIWGIHLYSYYIYLFNFVN